MAFPHAFFITTGLLMEGIIAHFRPSTMAATVVVVVKCIVVYVCLLQVFWSGVRTMRTECESAVALQRTADSLQVVYYSCQATAGSWGM